MKYLERETIKDLLEQWELGKIDEKHVHSQAETLWGQEDWPNYSKEDPKSIAIEVLSQLDILNVQLIMKEDIPILIEFLNTEPGKELEAWKKWEKYWNNIDFEKRKMLVKDNPYYIT